MASIRKLPGNRSKPYRVEIRRQGKRIDETFRTKREATDFAAKVEADFNRWARLLGGELRKHTFADLVDRYVSQWTGKDASTLTRLAWWRDRLGDLRLSEVDIGAIREALAALALTDGRDGKLKPATLNATKSALSGCYRTAIDKGWYGIQDNPCAGIRAMKVNNARYGRALEDQERGPLLEACDASERWTLLGLFVRLALTTGGRRSELLRLEWRDIDLNRGSVLFRDTKNGEDRRVPLLPEVHERIKALAKVRAINDPHVFPVSSRHQLDKAWTAAKNAAGVENLRLHDLRHSCGSYLAKAGASAFQIAAILGHRSGPGLTARYVHLAAEDNRELLEAALSGVLTGSRP